MMWISSLLLSLSLFLGTAIAAPTPLVERALSILSTAQVSPVLIISMTSI